MTDSHHPPAEELLHAYVDGFLEAGQREEVERYLAANPGEALRFEAYRQQNEALLGLRELPLRQPFALPEFGPSAGARLTRRWALRGAAATVLLSIGGAAGWLLRGQADRTQAVWMRMIQQAENAHLTYVPEVLHPVEVTQDNRQHLRTWLSRRLGAPIALPILVQHGYDLVGGRLLPADPGPAAQFMYQDNQGNRLTLFVLVAPAGRSEKAFRYVKKGPLWICYWMGQSIDFALTGDVPRDTLLAMAKTIYMQLNNVQPPGMDASW